MIVDSALRPMGNVRSLPVIKTCRPPLPRNRTEYSTNAFRLDEFVLKLFLCLQSHTVQLSRLVAFVNGERMYRDRAVS